MEKNKLVRVSSSDGLYLHGYYIPNKNKKVVVLHIHGFEGNFYENNFVYVLADELEKSQIGFLSVNTRGNGRDTDFNTVSGGCKKVGARYELLEEAHLDISAWIKFLMDEGYEQIVLQGHSLGTLKVVRYLSEGEYKDKVKKLILLAPFDKKGAIDASGREDIMSLLKKARTIVDEGKGEELITREFDDIDLSYNSYISWYGEDELGRMFEFCSPNYDFPALKKIAVPTKIIVGSKDEYFHLSNPEHPEEAMKILLKYIPISEGRIIDGAVHSFKPHEIKMADEVVKFVNK